MFSSDEAQKYKDLGNESFKKKNYEDALAFYQKSIGIPFLF
jgi:hypothetical protein